MVARTATSIIGLYSMPLSMVKSTAFKQIKLLLGIMGMGLITLGDIAALKLQEATIKQSEARYRAFIENSQDGI